MKTRKLATLLSGLVWLAALVGRAGIAMAGAAPRKGSAVVELPASTPIWPIVCTVVLVAGVCVVAFKSAGRARID